jgi:hypothetical protein
MGGVNAREKEKTIVQNVLNLTILAFLNLLLHVVTWL